MTFRGQAMISKEGKWYVAQSVELGVASQGRTLKEAKKNLEEAVALYLEGEGISPDISESYLTTIEVKTDEKKAAVR